MKTKRTAKYFNLTTHNELPKYGQPNNYGNGNSFNMFKTNFRDEELNFIITKKWIASHLEGDVQTFTMWEEFTREVSMFFGIPRIVLPVALCRKNDKVDIVFALADILKETRETGEEKKLQISYALCVVKDMSDIKVGRGFNVWGALGRNRKRYGEVISSKTRDRYHDAMITMIKAAGIEPDVTDVTRGDSVLPFTRMCLKLIEDGKVLRQETISYDYETKTITRS